jgi:hypothetical protein
VVVIGGQTLSLLLTLLVTPVAYSLFDDIASSGWLRCLRRTPLGPGSMTETPEPAVSALSQGD